MAPKIVRDSKYRHVHAEVFRGRFDGLRVSTKTTEGASVQSNGKYLAFTWQSGGGGALCILDANKPGRLGAGDMPLIHGHQGAILDFQFSPFNEHILATVAEDGNFRIFQIPEEGIDGSLREPAVQVQHPKKVSLLAHHPRIQAVTTASYDNVIRTWDVETQDQVGPSTQFQDLIMSIAWSFEGSLMAVTSKDKNLHLCDPRTSDIAASVLAHQGTKPTKCCWFDTPGGDSPEILTTGFSAQAERQYALWDIRKMSEPKLHTTVDTGTGVFYPHYDKETKLLFLAGKGDGNVKYFEYSENNLYFIDDYSTNVPQRGFGFVPKLSMDVSKHEVVRGVKLESGAAQVVSFCVPRRTDLFQEDIFPDTPEMKVALSVNQWAQGQVCPKPTLISMDPKKKRTGEEGTPQMQVSFNRTTTMQLQLEEAKKTICELEKERDTVVCELRKSTYGLPDNVGTLLSGSLVGAESLMANTQANAGGSGGKSSRQSIAGVENLMMENKLLQTQNDSLETQLAGLRAEIVSLKNTLDSKDNIIQQLSININAQIQDMRKSIKESVKKSAKKSVEASPETTIKRSSNSRASNTTSKLIACGGSTDNLNAILPTPMTSSASSTEKLATSSASSKEHVMFTPGTRMSREDMIPSISVNNSVAEAIGNDPDVVTPVVKVRKEKKEKTTEKREGERRDTEKREKIAEKKEKKEKKERKRKTEDLPSELGRETLRDPLRDTVDNVRRDTLRETLDGSVRRDTLRGTVDDVKRDTLRDTVDNVKRETICDTVRDTQEVKRQTLRENGDINLVGA